MIGTIRNSLVLLLILTIAPAVANCLLYGETYKLKENVEIKELFTLGVDDETAKEDDPYLFYDIYKAYFDSMGKLYVLDGKANSVKVFDQKGKYLTTHFRSGQGPKEISNPFKLAINPFNNHIFILQDYGYTLNEFDASGNNIERRMLPQQFFGHIEFLAKNKILYHAFNTEHTKEFDCFKVLNLATGKIEASFGKVKEDDDTHNNVLRFAVVDNMVWTSPGKFMVLQGYDLNSGKKIKEIRIPGNHKENIIKTKKTERGHYLVMIYFNTAQVFSVGGKVFVMAIHQEYKKKKDSYEDWPYKTRHQLWMLKGDQLVDLGSLIGFDFMYLEQAWKNRVVFQAPLPYPQIKVIEINVK